MRKSTVRRELDPRAPVPLYEQIEQRLFAELRAPGYDREQLSDAALMQRFGVSRMTVRNAIESLVRRGLLRRVPGRGTFVVEPPPVEVRLDGLERFMQEWHQPHVNTRARILTFRKSAASAEIARDLDVAAGSPVLLVRRLRESDDGTPLILDVRFVAGWCMHGITRADAAKQSLFVTIAERTGTQAASVEQVVTAGLAPESVATILRIPVGAALLERRSTFLASDGRPLLTGHSFYRADRVKFQMRAARNDGP